MPEALRWLETSPKAPKDAIPEPEGHNPRLALKRIVNDQKEEK